MKYVTPFKYVVISARAAIMLLGHTQPQPLVSAPLTLSYERYRYVVIGLVKSRPQIVKDADSVRPARHLER